MRITNIKYSESEQIPRPLASRSRGWHWKGVSRFATRHTGRRGNHTPAVPAASFASCCAFAEYHWHNIIISLTQRQPLFSADTRVWCNYIWLLSANAIIPTVWDKHGRYNLETLPDTKCFVLLFVATDYNGHDASRSHCGESLSFFFFSISDRARQRYLNDT